MGDTGPIEPLLDDIYDAGLDAALWPRVLERLARHFGSGSAHLTVDVASDVDSGAAQPRMVSFGTDPGYVRSYAEYYATRNVYWDRIVARSLDGIFSNRLVMPKDEARRSEFYNDYLRPQEAEEIMGAVAVRRGSIGTSFTLWRPERHGPWQKSDMKRLASIGPHLQRAVRLNERIGAIKVASGLAVDALHCLNDGVVLVDGEGIVCFANQAAEAVFAAKTLRLEHNRLSAPNVSDADRLRRLVGAAAQDGCGGSLVLARTDRAPLLVWVIPLRPEACPLTRGRRGAMLLIRDLERPAGRSLHAFAEHFGLTSAEEAVAEDLTRGDGVNAVAARLGLSRATVRTHLVRIFQKTGTGRQAELVRFILEWTGGLQLTSGRRLS